ncbi:DHH family phosphoesterase [Candidatus Uhrbacteria bacterium]|nr:DHH family phosphoesterase [Candidatus Uhrbacteria bacterium]
MNIKFVYQEAHEILRQARSILVVSHRKPDGDTLGAACAVLNYARSIGKDAVGFCVDVLPEQYRYIPGTERYANDPSVFLTARPDVIAVFDASDLAFAGVLDFIAAVPHQPTIINFDHHATNVRFGDINALNVTASSTAEVVYDFLNAGGVEITREIATCLLTGILTDTGSFSNPATTASSLEAASDLLRRGASIHEVARRLMRNKPLKALHLWGAVLARLKYDERLGVATTAIFRKDLEESGVEDEHVEGLSNFLNSFLNAKVVLVLKELPGGLVKGSFRTADEIDVSAIAKLMGGGGHKKAAGFTAQGRIVEGEKGWRVE